MGAYTEIISRLLIPVQVFTDDFSALEFLQLHTGPSCSH